MPRPKKLRKICGIPEINRFGPIGMERDINDFIQMTVDEYETIRLIDMEGLTQEECAEQMIVARTTVQGIYNRARKKLADSLVNGKGLIIEGGEYRLCNGSGPFCGKGRSCSRHRFSQGHRGHMHRNFNNR